MVDVGVRHLLQVLREIGHRRVLAADHGVDIRRRFRRTRIRPAARSFGLVRRRHLASPAGQRPYLAMPEYVAPIVPHQGRTIGA